MTEAVLSADAQLIELHFSYDKRLIDLTKTVDGYKWHKGPLIWTYPASPWHAHQVTTLDFGWDKIDEGVLALSEKYDRLLKLSKKTRGRRMGKLYPFQSVAVEFIEETGGRCVLGDEMGLGKTIEFLGWLNKRDDIGKVLVVAPANVIYKWADEILKWTDREGQVVSSSRDELEVGKMHVMSYGIMSRRTEELKEHGYQLICFDECHYLKGQAKKTIRVRQAIELCEGVPYIIGMSGTPFPNRPAELFNMLHLLNATAYPYFWPFGNKYCGGQAQMFGGATNRSELAERLSSIMVRRLKTEVLTQLPVLTRSLIPIDLPNMDVYIQAEDEVLSAIRSMNPKHKGYYVNALDRLNLLRQVVGKGKAQAVLPWCQNFMETTNSKLVLYCHHTEVVNELKKGLVNYGVSTIVGGTPPKERYKRATKFQSEATPRILCISSAGGEGIDLFGVDGVDASTIIFVEREWTPAVEEQAESRLHRNGQVNGVSALYVLARHTVDEKIDRLINYKRQVQQDVVRVNDIEMSVVHDLLEDIREGR
jgi:SWI/SNF-related matrix-associated actin-dependent regulator 1 of chromatin subfamily A